MIPKFPEFKKIEISDKGDIQSFIHGYKPYSDFDFTTFWMWDVDGKRGWAELNGNLVTRFTDYLTGEIFYSFFGVNDVNENIQTLLEFAKSSKAPALRLIPDFVVDRIDFHENIFLIEEDQDNFDYVYNIKKLVDYPGYTYAQQRKMRNRFVSRYSDVSIVPLDLGEHHVEIKALVKKWEENKTLGYYNEEEAFNKVIESADSFPLMNVGVMVQKKLVGFTVNEIIDENFAISHFAKADTAYTGIYSYMMRETANMLAFQGCKFLNCEQDLGIPGLRQAKGSYRPEFFLKKYTLR